MFKLLASAQELERGGQRVIHFEIGDLGFRSPAAAVENAVRALRAGETNYTDSRGLFEMREAVRHYARQLHGVTATIEQVLIAPANAAIDFAFRCVADPGDEIIVPDPCFPTYAAVAAYSNINLKRVPLRAERGFRLDPSDVAAAVTRKTKLIVLNSPHNPTGACIPGDDVEAIYQIAAEHGVFILTDEVYARLLYHGEHFSAAAIDHCRKLTILLGSLSKSHAMAGWRLGYLVGPPHFIEKATLVLQTILSCLPAFTQRGGIAALENDEQFHFDLLQTLRRRRDILVNGLKSIPGCQCSLPGGAFYAFPKMGIPGMTDDEYAARLLREEGVCILPGYYFGPSAKGHMRFSFAASSDDDILDALVRIKGFQVRHSAGY